jgi:hypothetical protein
VDGIYKTMLAAAPTPPVPVLQLETQLSDRDVKALHGYLAQAGAATPPAQESEPVAEVTYEYHGQHEVRKAFLYKEGTELPNGTQLYTRPRSDELRKAAEEAVRVFFNSDPTREEGISFSARMLELRAELERQL